MTETAIDVSDVSFRYPGVDEPILENANLRIERGEFIAILGGNGSGKTTLCKTFNGLVPNFFEGDFDGRVRVAGQNTRDASVADLSRDVGYVFQEFENQLVTPTVYDEMTFGPVNYGQDDYRERALNTLSQLDIETVDGRFIWELSGGQQHLVALGAALTMDPDILVVDEPAAQLDPVRAHKTYERLQELNENGITIVTIEHHTEFIAEYCDTVALVADGTVKWKRPTDEGLNRIEELREHRIHPPQVTRVARKIEKGENLPTTYADAINRYRSLEHETGQTDDHESAQEQSRDEPIISFQRVDHGYTTLRDGDVRVLEDFSLDLYPNERIALVGANGAGKSTLLRLITGIEKPDAGRVTIDGTDTGDVLPEELAADITYVDQNPEDMFIQDSVRGDISYYLRERDVADVEKRVDEVIEFLDLEQLQDRDGRLLSVGEQRRASLGIGLATDPSIVLFDEPTGSLDLASRREVEQTINRAENRVETVVIATHDLELVAEWATRVIVLNDGAIETDGTLRDVFSNLDLLERCNLRAPQVVRLSDDLGISPPAMTVAELADRLSERSTESRRIHR